MAFNKKKGTEGAVSGAAMGTSISPGWGTLIGGAAGGLLGGFAGGDDGEAQRKQQDELMEQTLAELAGVSIPELRRIQYENPQWLEDLQAEELDPSQMKYVNTDPRLKSEQMAAMAALNEISEGGGMNMQDRANLAQIQNETATADKGRRDALMQNMRQRGMAGSGMELLANLQSNQAATDRSAQQGLDVAGMAQNRALDSIMQSGNLAGGMRSQEFGEQSKKAEAADAINRFNSQNRQDVNRYNIGGRQDMSNQGINTRNQNQTMNNAVQQQNFENQMNKVGATGQARGQQIGMIGQNRTEDIQANANKMASYGKIASSFGDYYQNRDRKKKDDQDNGGF